MTKDSKAVDEAPADEAVAPIPEDTETTKALEEQAEAEAAIAEEHLLPADAPQMSREDYDKIGKGEGYEAKDWGPSTRPDDRTFAGTETPVAKPARKP